MLKTKRFFLIAIFFGVISSLAAQTDSPYSRYAYGMLRDQAVGLSKSMGGIGYGLRDNQSANPLNPASYSKVDSLTFLFDMGVWGNMGTLSDATHKENHPNGGLDYITILFPVVKHLGLSLGILPYSSVGYSFGTHVNQNDISYDKQFTGSGGLSQIYLGAGYQLPLKGLSFGLNTSFLFGTLRHERELSNFNPSDANTSSERSELIIKSFKLDIGLQYDLALANTNHLVLGAVYTPQMNTKGDYENHHIEAGVDTQDIYNSGIDAGFPDTYGFGLTFCHNNQWTLGADFTYQKWSNAKYSSVTVMGDDLTKDERFNDTKKIAVGAEYIIKPISRNFFNKIRFRGGINYSNSYFNVKNSDGNIAGYNQFGATLGFGLPIRDKQALGNRISYINIGFDYKKISSSVKNMISESYLGMSISVNLNELWFLQRKIY